MTHFGERTLPLSPKLHEISLTTNAALKLVAALQAIIHDNRENTVTLIGPTRHELSQGTIEKAFQNAPVDKLAEGQGVLPLQEFWEVWFDYRPADMRDPDGFEVLRAYEVIHTDAYKNSSAHYHYHYLIRAILATWMRDHPTENTLPFIFQALETTLAQRSKHPIPTTDSNYKKGMEARLRNHPDVWWWYRQLTSRIVAGDTSLSEAEMRRVWGIIRWVDEPFEGLERHHPPVEFLAKMHDIGIATDADVYDALIGRHISFSELEAMSLNNSPLLQNYPKLRLIYERVRDQILDIELARGEARTEMSIPALILRSLHGAETFLRILTALGNQPVERIPLGIDHRASVFSRLLRVTLPLPDDSPADFVLKAKSLKLPEKHWIAAAMWSPAWGKYIEGVLGWAGFASGIYWLHAHAKEIGWPIDYEIQLHWKAEIATHTPLSSEALSDGAADVAWFKKTYQALSEKRWKQLYNAAKYMSRGNDHARAQLYASVMLGTTTEEELLTRIIEKRNPDAVLAFGLLPLPEDKTAREAVLLNRRRILQEFASTSSKSGSQRRKSENLAVKVALDNLARTEAAS